MKEIESVQRKLPVDPVGLDADIGHVGNRASPDVLIEYRKGRCPADVHVADVRVPGCGKEGQHAIGPLQTEVREVLWQALPELGVGFLHGYCNPDIWIIESWRGVTLVGARCALVNIEIRPGRDEVPLAELSQARALSVMPEVSRAGEGYRSAAE